MEDLLCLEFTHRIHTRLICIVLFVILGFVTASAVAQEAGFKPIFNGRTLDGWKAAEMSYWSVKDGAITGRSTQQNPVKSNQFLVWQLGDVDDFELKLKYRISGTPAANSGIPGSSKPATPSVTRRTSTGPAGTPGRFMTSEDAVCSPSAARKP